MSVWRIDKIDAQTRTLAEAAAKAAGLPLGAWLERAIMRRVQKGMPQAPLVASPAAGLSQKPEAEPEISAEMQAALDAAERRRRQRAGQPEETRSAAEPVAELADHPFATPEKESDDTLYEQPDPAETQPNGDAAPEAVLQIAEDEPIIVAGTDEPVEARAEETPVEPIFTEPADALPPAPVVDATPIEPMASDVAAQDDRTVGVTSRQPVLVAPPPPESQRRLSSGLIYGALGLAAVAAAAAGGYFFFARPQPELAQATANASTPPAPESPATPAAERPPEASPAPPASPASAGGQAAAPVASPPSDASPAAATAAAPSSPPAAGSAGEEPRAPAASDSAAAASTDSAPPPAAAQEPAPPPATVQDSPPPPLAPPAGPSIANLALMDAAPTPAMPAAEPAPPPAAAADRKPPTANETLPALRKRAEAGELDAQLELGRRYLDGSGVGRNETEAGKWLLRAAEQGNPQAQFNIGVMYERGIGLAPDLGKALEYYRKSAAQSTPMALHNLALLHTGEHPGVKADLAQARRLMTQAAELGQTESQYSLAMMHLQGVGGPSDRAMALSWMAIAARPNLPQLIDAARQLSAQLSEPERQRARQLAEGHVRKIQANLARLRAGQPVAQAAAAQEPAPARPRVVDRAAIVEMQTLLAALKIYAGSADGAMGPRTAAAIREFQTMAGMTVDGKPSIELLESLREVAGLTQQ
ncbi:MAG: peptidoglycan-binding protein [Reyranellaceae bacterium]